MTDTPARQKTQAKSNDKENFLIKVRFIKQLIINTIIDLYFHLSNVAPLNFSKGQSNKIKKRNNAAKLQIIFLIYNGLGDIFFKKSS